MNGSTPPSATSPPSLAIVSASAAFAGRRELGLSPSTLSHVVARSRPPRRPPVPSVDPQRVPDRGRRAPFLAGAGLRGLDLGAGGSVERFRQPPGSFRLNASRCAARLLWALCAEVPGRLPRDVPRSGDRRQAGRHRRQRFRCGMRLAEAVPQDMISVHSAVDAALVRSRRPAMSRGRGPPTVPADLYATRASASGCRAARVPRWEFERHGQADPDRRPGAD